MCRRHPPWSAIKCISIDTFPTLELCSGQYAYLLARSASPDADRMALDCVLAAECACVSCVLRDFDLLDLFAEGGTITEG